MQGNDEPVPVEDVDDEDPGHATQGKRKRKRVAQKAGRNDKGEPLPMDDTSGLTKQQHHVWKKHAQDLPQHVQQAYKGADKKGQHQIVKLLDRQVAWLRRVHRPRGVVRRLVASAHQIHGAEDEERPIEGHHIHRDARETLQFDFSIGRRIEARRHCDQERHVFLEAPD